MNDTKPVEEETYVYLIIVHSVHCQDVILSFVLLHLLIKVVNIHTCFDMRGRRAPSISREALRYLHSVHVGPTGSACHHGD